MIYLDLSFILQLATIGLVSVWINTLFRVQWALKKYAVFYGLIGFFYSISFFLFPYAFILLLTGFITIVYGLQKKIKISFSWFFIYFLLNLSMAKILPSISFKEGRLLVHHPSAMIALVILPWWGLALIKGWSNTKKAVRSFPQIRAVECQWEGHSFVLQGYFDSGNRAQIQGQPIILLAKSFKPYEPVTQTLITKDYRGHPTLLQGFAGTLRIIPGHRKAVMFAVLPNQLDFFGCECLLNFWVQ